MAHINHRTLLISVISLLQCAISVSLISYKVIHTNILGN